MDEAQTMRAMVLKGHGGMEQLVWEEAWPRPTPGPGEVLLKVGACGLNNTDVNTRTGWYSKAVTGATQGDGYEALNEEDPAWGGTPIVFPRIQGADVAGEIVALGEGADPALLGRRALVDCWQRSEDLDPRRSRFLGSELDGGFAEYLAVPARNLACIDSALSEAELASFPCAYTTAEGMLSRAELKAGERIVITGASGGVGSALIQLSKLRGATVVALASPKKHAALRALGADLVLERSPEDLGGALAAAFGDAQLDVVADVVGGSGFGRLIEALSRRGRYVCSGAIAGPLVELDLRTLYLKDLSFFGSTVIGPEIFPRIVSYIEAGQLKPLVAASYPLAELHTAQRAFMDKAHSGNIVVTP